VVVGVAVGERAIDVVMAVFVAEVDIIRTVVIVLVPRPIEGVAVSVSVTGYWRLTTCRSRTLKDAPYARESLFGNLQDG
jgi:hypothetical protein